MAVSSSCVVATLPANAGAFEGLRLSTMAYDKELADRLHELLDGEPGLSEQRMFGGLAFLVHGNMAIAASAGGGALVRVDPADSDQLVASTGAQVAVMGGRSMPGWLQVAPEDLMTEAQLAAWVKRGVDYASSLPAKKDREP
jgi:TfoX/Sxy family transcriptional regulator of competence genes